MKIIEINNIKYIIEKDFKNGIDNELLTEYITDYFTEFDYIFGDWSYGKLRLKGFNDESNKKSNEYNNIKNINKYIKDYCAYGCSHFILKKAK